MIKVNHHRPIFGLVIYYAMDLSAFGQPSLPGHTVSLSAITVSLQCHYSVILVPAGCQFSSVMIVS